MAYPPSGMSPNMGNSAGSSSSLFNSISSAGLPMENPANKAQQPETESPSDRLLARFSQAFNAFKDLTAVPEYSVAADKASEVKKAMNNWLAEVHNKLPSAPSGEESTGTSY